MMKYTLTKIVLFFQIFLLTGCHSEKINFEKISIKSGVEGVVHYYDKKTYTGLIIKKDSKSQTIFSVKDGLLDGELIKYSDSNIKILIENYKENKLNGNKYIFYTDGSIYEKSSFWDNRLVGEYKLYYPNGQIKRIAEFDSFGKKVGKWKKFKNTGEIIEIINY